MVTLTLHRMWKKCHLQDTEAGWGLWVTLRSFRYLDCIPSNDTIIDELEKNWKETAVA
jgi:hypothetical protein